MAQATAAGKGGVLIIPGLPPLKVIERQQLTSTATAIVLPASGTIANAAPSGSKHVVVVINAAFTGGADDIDLYFGTGGGAVDTTAGNYNGQSMEGVTSTASAARRGGAVTIPMGIPDDGSGDRFGGGAILIPDAFNTDTHKSALAMGGPYEDGIRIDTSRWENTGVLTSVGIQGGTFAVGSVFELCVIDEDYAVAGAAIDLSADGDVIFKDLDGLVQDGDVVAIGNLRTNSSGSIDTVKIEFNDDTTTGNYEHQSLDGDGTTVTAAAASDNNVGEVTGGGAITSAFSPFILSLSAFGKAVNDPHCLGLSGHHSLNSGHVELNSGRRNNVAAVTKIQLKPAQV